MPKKQASNSLAEEARECDCNRCRVQKAIFAVLGEDWQGDGTCSLDPYGALTDLTPTLGILLAGIEAKDCEVWWRVCLEARSQALDPRSSLMGPAVGRA